MELHHPHLHGAIAVMTFELSRNGKGSCRCGECRLVHIFLPTKHVSLRGEAEEELEYCPLDSINNDKGIDFILESLRKPLMTRSIYLKRRYLHEYENVQRQANESIKAYCNRYHRTERPLESIGVNVGLMYDSEARGSRLLDRMRISLEQQRLILIGSGQSLHFDDIKEAAQLQFPDHRPTPMVTFMREFEAKEKNQTSSSSQPGFKGNFFKKGKGKGKEKSGGKGSNRTYVTENVPDNDNTENRPKMVQTMLTMQLPPMPKKEEMMKNSRINKKVWMMMLMRPGRMKTMTSSLLSRRRQNV